MSQIGRQEKFAVLFVDDEEKTLRYFRIAYGSDFPVLTASSVAEAMEILQRQSDETCCLNFLGTGSLHAFPRKTTI